MKKTLIILIVNILVLIGVAIFVNIKYVPINDTNKMLNIIKKEKPKELTKIAKNYDNDQKIKNYDSTINKLKKTNSLKEINSNYLLNIPKKDDNVYIYIGRNNCKYCQTFLPELEKELEANNLSIYYLDSNVQKDKHTKDFEKVLSKFKVEGVPTLLMIRDGKSEAFGTVVTDLETFLN